MRHTPCGYCPPYPRRSGLPSPPEKVSAKQTDEGLGAVPMYPCNLRSPAAPVGADDPVRPLLPVSSARKGTVSSCQEKKAGKVPTAVLKFSRKISAFIRPSLPYLPSERASRSAHRLSAELRRKIVQQSTARHHQDRVRRSVRGNSLHSVSG